MLAGDEGDCQMPFIACGLFELDAGRADNRIHAQGFVMNEVVSIAIETSCRAGGVAIGVGDELGKCIDFDASARQATQLVARLRDLLTEAGLSARDIGEVYVAAGPGSFTGLRVGITVARTLGQMLPNVRCVAVETPAAVAENVRDLDWQHLGVLLDAKDDHFFSCLFTRKNGEIVHDGEPGIMIAEEFIAAAPRPLLLSGEALNFHEISGDGISVADESLRMPTAEGVWRAGRKLSARGEFIDYHQLLPVYVREPEAVRLWNLKQQG